MPNSSYMDGMRSIKPKTYTAFPTRQNGNNNTSSVNEFLNRAHKASNRTQEHGSDGQDWEVVDGAKAKKIAEDAEDEEWCVVGKPDADKEMTKKKG